MPGELLSDQGSAFLSKMMIKLYGLLGTKKVSTTACHPQTDRLVERFNCTLTDMLSKKVHRLGKDWDVQLPYVLFAYRSSPQESTRESHFFFLYGRNTTFPSKSVFNSRTPITREIVDLKD